MAKTHASLRFSDLSPKDLAAERARRAAGAQRVDFTDPKFPKQTAFLNDEARFKLALCTRRAGKSEGAARDLLQCAVNVPGSVGIFFGRTRLSAKNVVWRILRKYIDKFQLSVDINKTELCITFSNGSQIFLAGVDATADEREKYLGMALYRVYIDECASHRQDLYELVCGVIMPALVDHDGSVILLGTPGNFTKGLFYRLSSGKALPSDPPCSIHHWTAFDNPYMAKKWAAEIEKIKRERPGFMLTPLFAQHYLGKWVVDDARRIYHFDDDKNLIKLPLHEAPWKHVIGVDLGYEDDSAFVVLAHSPADTNVYAVYSHKKKGMDITSVANHIKDLLVRFGTDSVVVIDNAAKQSVMEMVRRHDLALIAAQKQEKAQFQAILDSELIEGKVKIAAGESCNPLVDEICRLIKADPKPGQTVFKEDPNCDNHLCDAFLYAWRYTYGYMGRLPTKPVERGTPEAFILDAKAMEESAKLRQRREAEAAAENWGITPSSPREQARAIADADDWGVGATGWELPE